MLKIDIWLTSNQGPKFYETVLIDADEIQLDHEKYARFKYFQLLMF